MQTGKEVTKVDAMGIMQAIKARVNLPISTLSLSDEEWEQRKVDDYNAEQGDLQHLNCPICKNKGYVAVLVEGTCAMQVCKCREARSSAKRMAKSGIVEECTLDNYEATQKWQKQLLYIAKSFAKRPDGWFFLGGQSGSGKTHICTGIVRELLDNGHEARYMMWRDDSTKIKANVNNPEEYAKLVEPLKTVKVLYIDDLFKTNNGNAPTAADVNLAFEILNVRYNRRDLVTILSSEYVISELLDIDEAVGSRIFQRAFGNVTNIPRDKKYNYRLKGITRGGS